MEWFGGNPQYAFYGGIAAVLYLAGRLWQQREVGARGAARAIVSFALIYVLGSVLAGVQLMPALELFSVSSRPGQTSYAWVRTASFVPEGALEFLVPDLFGAEVGVPYWGRWNLWEMSPYVGVVAFGLAFIAVLRGRRARALLPGCLALICVLMAMAGNAAFFGLIPGFDLFRSQARWLCPASLFIGLLAGLGADGIAATTAAAAPVEAEKSAAHAHGRGMWMLACLAALLILIGGVLCSEAGFGRAAWLRFMDAMLQVGNKAGYDERLSLHEWMRTPSAEFKLAAMRTAGLSMLRAGLFLGALAGLVRLTLRARIKPAWAAGALLGLMAVDAWTFGQRYLTTFDPRDDGLSPGAVEFFANRPEPFRFGRGGVNLPPCEGMTHHFCCIEGVQPNAPARFRDIFWSLQGESMRARAMDGSFTSYFLYTPGPTIRMLNLRYLVAYPSRPQVQIEGLHTVYEDRRIRIDEMPDPWPRAWLVHHYGVLGNRQALLKEPLVGGLSARGAPGGGSRLRHRGAADRGCARDRAGRAVRAGARGHHRPGRRAGATGAERSFLSRLGGDAGRPPGGNPGGELRHARSGGSRRRARSPVPLQARELPVGRGRERGRMPRGRVADFMARVDAEAPGRTAMSNRRQA